MFGLDKLVRAGAREGDGAEPRDKRTLLLLGGLGAVLVLVLGYLLVLPALTGSSDTSAGSSEVPGHTVSAAPKAESTSVPSLVAPSPVTPVGNFRRDPFAPLPEEAAAAAAQAASLTTGSTTGTAGSTTATSGPTTATSGSATTGATSSGSTDSGTTSSTTTSQSAPAGGASGVQYVGRTNGIGIVEVDGQRADVIKGATFGSAKQYTCVSLSDASITVSHGDTVKTLTKGESQTF